MGAIKMVEVTRSDFIESIHYEKTISIRVSGFILTCGERGHRKFFSSTTYPLQSVQCICSVCSMFFRFLKVKF